LSEQYNIITASEGNEAFRLLKGKQADLVISDVMMPGMNGLEFVGKLRKKTEYQHLPVIFLSAKNHELDVETGLSTGADIYLTKPIQSKLLLSQIAAVLRREKILSDGSINNQKSEENELMRQIREIVYRQMANPSLNITVLADTLFMSRTTLYKEWNKISDISLNDFIKQIRLNEAKILLSEKDFSVQEAATAAGYSDANYFSTSFKKEFGVSPSEI
jgi:YesN/AraC family two-component response regulator